MHLFMVSRILLIAPIFGFALAAPVPVQEKRRACADSDMADLPEYSVTVLGKRGEIEEVGGKYIENWFAKPEESSAARPSSSSPPSKSDHERVDVKQPQPPIPEGRLPVSDDALTGMHAPLSSPVLPTWIPMDHGLTGVHAPQPNLGPSGHMEVKEPPSRTTSSLSEFDEYQVVRPQSPPPSSASPAAPDPGLTGVHALLSSPVLPTWFLPDHGPHMTVEEPPSRPASATGFDTDHEYQVVHPPPSQGSASSTESDHEMVHVPPSSPVSSTNPGRRSMGEDPRLENLQAVSDPLKGNAKESRRISGAAKDVLDAAQR